MDKLGAGIQVCEGLSTVPDPTELAKVLAMSVGDRTWHDIRARAVDLGKAALKAISSGGTSHMELDAMIIDLTSK